MFFKKEDKNKEQKKPNEKTPLEKEIIRVENEIQIAFVKMKSIYNPHGEKISICLGSSLKMNFLLEIKNICRYSNLPAREKAIIYEKYNILNSDKEEPNEQKTNSKETFSKL